MSYPTRFRLAAACKFLCFAICLFVAIGGRPPMQAAQPSIIDVQQDDHLLRLDDKTDVTGNKVAELQTQIRELERVSAERTGEERIIGLVVSLLSGGSFVLQFKRKKE